MKSKINQLEENSEEASSIFDISFLSKDIGIGTTIGKYLLAFKPDPPPIQHPLERLAIALARTIGTYNKILVAQVVLYSSKYFIFLL